MVEPLVWLPMSGAEMELISALAACSIKAGFSKRFARDLAWRAAEKDPRITAKQSAMLRKLVSVFRRQVRLHIDEGKLTKEDRWLLTEEYAEARIAEEKLKRGGGR